MHRLHFLSIRHKLILPIWLILSFSISLKIYAQDQPPAYAVTNVTIHQAGLEPILSGTVIWRDGVITDVGEDLTIPFDAFTIDAGDSLHLYPGFIDGLNVLGSPDDKWEELPGSTPGSPTYERAGVAPQRSPSSMLTRSKDGEEALKRGFTSVNLVPKGRMLPGSTELALIHYEIQKSTLIKETGTLFRFQGSGGGWTSRAYPSTDMAVIAKFRQLLYEATALDEHLQFLESRNGSSLPVVDKDPVLMALIPILKGEKSLFFELANSEDLDRFFALQDEFGFRAVIITGVDITDWSGEIKRRNIQVLSTLRVPDKPKWLVEEEKKEGEEDSVETEPQVEAQPEWKIEEERLFNARQKQAWTQEVKSLSALLNSGVTVGYAGIGTSAKEFRNYIKLLLEDGQLTSEDLLKMMTTSNAEIFGLNERLGSIRPGAIASFTIFSDEFTAKDTDAIMTVTNGQIHNWE